MASFVVIYIWKLQVSPSGWPPVCQASPKPETLKLPATWQWMARDDWRLWIVSAKLNWQNLGNGKCRKKWRARVFVGPFWVNCTQTHCPKLWDNCPNSQIGSSQKMVEGLLPCWAGICAGAWTSFIHPTPKSFREAQISCKDIGYSKIGCVPCRDASGKWRFMEIPKPKLCDPGERRSQAILLCGCSRRLNVSQCLWTTYDKSCPSLDGRPPIALECLFHAKHPTVGRVSQRQS